MTAEDFQTRTGRPPEYDELERANCTRHPEVGHISCGWCVHNKPRWMCIPCLQRVIVVTRES